MVRRGFREGGSDARPASGWCEVWICVGCGPVGRRHTHWKMGEEMGSCDLRPLFTALIVIPSLSLGCELSYVEYPMKLSIVEYGHGNLLHVCRSCTSRGWALRLRISFCLEFAALQISSELLDG